MSGVGRYNHFSREAVVELLEQRDSERRYGLVSERKGIEADRARNDDLVALGVPPRIAGVKRASKNSVYIPAAIYVAVYYR